MLLFLLACQQPYADLVEWEEVWWDANRLEQETGIDLVDVQAGEPIGYWPRIVIEKNGIGVDDRAWFLSLPPEVFEGDEDPRRYITDRRRVLDLDDGRIPGDDQGTWMIPELYDVLLSMAESHKELGAYYTDVEFDGRIVVIVEPEITGDTLSRVLYTAGQAQWGRPAYTGRVGTRLRHVAPFDPRECLHLATANLADDTQWVDWHGELPPMAVDETCGGTPAELGAALDRLAATCQTAWSTMEADPCIKVMTSISPRTRATTMMRLQSDVYTREHLGNYTVTSGTEADRNECPDVLYALDQLTDTQQQAFCAAMPPPRARGQVASVSPPDPAVVEAFPAWGDQQTAEDGNTRDGIDPTLLKGILGTGTLDELFNGGDEDVLRIGGEK